jgi:transcriptional regulator with XRE-family HTH domain
MNFDIIKDAGISQQQFASLVGVSRITINTWVTGRFTPRPTLRHRVRKALAALEDAVERGELPIYHEVPNATLARKLKEIEEQVKQE